MIRLENVLKTSLQDVLKISWIRLEGVFKTSWRHLEDVLKTFLQDVLKTFWRRFEEVFPRLLEDVLKMYWKRLKNILKTHGQGKYTGLDQDVFWRRMTKENIFFLIKTSWRHLQVVFWRRRQKTSSRLLHQDECLLGLHFHCLINRRKFNKTKT